MTDKNFTNDYDPSQHIGFQTFKEKEEALKKRELPVLGTVEHNIVKYMSYTLAFYSVASMVALIVVILIGDKNESNNFLGNGGYGVLGLLSMILFFLCLAALTIFEMLYHTKWVEKADHKKEKNFLISGFYVTLFVLSLGYGTIWMRPNVMYRVGTWRGLGILLVVFALALAVAGIYLNFKQSEKNPILVRYFNLVVLLVVFWVPICNYALLASDVCNIHAAMYPLFASPVAAFLAFMFYCGQKKNTGFRTVASFFTYCAFFLQATSVFYYAMIEMPQVLAI